jgi:hypothetical protein
MDLHGTDTALAARELGVPDERITTIAAQVDGITPANGANAAPGALAEIAGLVAAGRLRVPIAASFPVEQIRTAVELQAGGTYREGRHRPLERSGTQRRLGVVLGGRGMSWELGVQDRRLARWSRCGRRRRDRW